MSATSTPSKVLPEKTNRDSIGFMSNQVRERTPSPNSAADSGDQYQVISCRTREDLMPHLDSWEQLAADADEPNVFYEPWVLLPALRLFARSEDIRIVMVCRISHGCPAPQVVGVFPLQFVRCFRFLPLRCARLWRHPHCYLTSPLIAPNSARLCWERVCTWLRRQHVQLLELNRASGEGAGFESLIDCCRVAGRPLAILNQYSRPMLRMEANTAAYLSRYISAGVRQTLNRKRRRLAECGDMTVATLQSGDDLTPWLDEFLALEASGWKGQEGTAMACHQEDKEYMATISREAHRRNRLSLVLLRINGKAVAGLYNLCAGKGAFQVKVAYDEQWGRFSPGILAYLETLRLFHEQRRCQWIDSCVAQSNTAARQVWKQHRQIADMVLAVGDQGAILLRLLPIVRKLKRAARWFCHLHRAGNSHGLRGAAVQSAAG